MNKPDNECVFDQDAETVSWFVNNAIQRYGADEDGFPLGPVCVCRKCRSRYRRKIEPKLHERPSAAIHAGTGQLAQDPKTGLVHFYIDGSDNCQWCGFPISNFNI